MVTLFRKLLIRVGKVIPFVFAFIVVISHIESIFAILNDDIILDLEGYYTYNVPISNYIGNIVYIDWFDVLLLYILAIALEFCWRNMLAVHYLLLNLAVRTLVEHFYIESGIVVGIASFMALAGLYCVYGGFKILLSK
jgi:hypothetical protein